MTGEDGFHVAEQLLGAASAEERARILLRVPDSVVLQRHEALVEACYAVNFMLGAVFLDVKLAALNAVKMADGRLPAPIGEAIAKYQFLVGAVAGVSR